MAVRIRLGRYVDRLALQSPTPSFGVDRLDQGQPEIAEQLVGVRRGRPSGREPDRSVQAGIVAQGDVPGRFAWAPFGVGPALEPMTVASRSTTVTDAWVRAAAVAANDTASASATARISCGTVLDLHDRDFAEAGRRLDQMPDEAFAPLGLSPGEVAALRERFADWPRT
jgi:hypothetical protein